MTTIKVEINCGRDNCEWCGYRQDVPATLIDSPKQMTFEHCNIFGRMKGDGKRLQICKEKEVEE